MKNGKISKIKLKNNNTKKYYIAMKGNISFVI